MDHPEHINTNVTNIYNTVLHIVCNHFYSFPSKTDIEQVANAVSTQSFLILQTMIDWIKYTREFLQCTQQGVLEKASMLKAKEKTDYIPILKYKQYTNSMNDFLKQDSSPSYHRRLLPDREG